MRKRDRNKVYKETLSLVKEDGWNDVGFCYFLSKACNKLNLNIDVYDEETMDKHFPEIIKSKPKLPQRCHWFPTMSGKDPKRERILNKAIKETES